MHTEQSRAVTLQSLIGVDDALQRLQQRSSGMYLLHGTSHVYAASLLVASTTRQPFAVIDGATKFNSYTLSAIAQLLGLAPKALLRQVYVTRSFTAFQTEAAIRIKLRHFLDRIPCPIIVVLGLLDTYYDEQVNATECLESLRRVLQTLRELTVRDAHIIIADVDITNPPQGKDQLFRLIRQSVDVAIQLEPNASQLFTSAALSTEERRVVAWGAITTPSRSLSTATVKRGASSVGR